MLKQTPDLESKLARLAWRCMATFRVSDYRGGCNGARIRFAPQKDWPVNKGLDKVLEQLEPVKVWNNDADSKHLSWADLIILGGTVALEHWTKSSAGQFKFCAGRTDAKEDGGASTLLQPRLTSNSSLLQLEDAIDLMGLTTTEFAVLNAAGYALGDKDCRSGENFGIFCKRPGAKTGSAPNQFFITLLNESWKPAHNGLFEAEGSPGTLPLFFYSFLAYDVSSYFHQELPCLALICFGGLVS